MSATIRPMGSSQGTYRRKRIGVVITLGNGQKFVPQNTNTLRVDGLRISVAIKNAGGISQGELDCRIYGMTLSDMNQITQVGGVPLTLSRNNIIQILTGEGDSQPTQLAYSGTIAAARMIASSQPDVFFQITAIGALAAAMQVAQPTSLPENADAAIILQGMAKQAGLMFENNGVSALLRNSYFPGSILDQIHEAAEEAGINAVIDNGTLAIWPKGQSRKGDIPLISPQTGLIGYPAVTNIGVEFSCLYRSNLKIGGQVKLQSSIQPACGTWGIYTLNHTIECEMPDGQWRSDVAAVPPGFI